MQEHLPSGIISSAVVDWGVWHKLLTLFFSSGCIIVVGINISALKSARDIVSTLSLCFIFFCPVLLGVGDNLLPILHLRRAVRQGGWGGGRNWRCQIQNCFSRRFTSNRTQLKSHFGNYILTRSPIAFRSILMRALHPVGPPLLPGGWRNCRGVKIPFSRFKMMIDIA